MERRRFLALTAGVAGAQFALTSAKLRAFVARDEDQKNMKVRKTEFEKHGLTLLGGPLSKEEIDNTV
jgi:hypothetical protein